MHMGNQFNFIALHASEFASRLIMLLARGYVHAVIAGGKFPEVNFQTLIHLPKDAIIHYKRRTPSA